jgi:peptide deformylase
MIHTYPAPILKQKCEPVTDFNEELKRLAESMFKEMREGGKGVGLAAPQIGVAIRMFVMHKDFMGTLGCDWAFINPEIIHKEGTFSYREGCLSFPGIYADIERAQTIGIKYQGTDGCERTEYFMSDSKTQFAATIIQHEMDHLDGIGIIDVMSPGQKMMIQNKLDKLTRKFKG